MALPEEYRMFSQDDVKYANKLLRRRRKDKIGSSTDLERPTMPENADIGTIKMSWRIRWKSLFKN